MPIIEAITSHEPLIRLACSAGIFSLVGAWEAYNPCRARILSRWRRWPSNLGIAALNTVLPRILFPTATIGFATFVEANNWGLLQLLGLPEPVTIALAIIALDLAIYLQHVLFHAAPSLWRLHRMHHADTEFDVTTGSRFHPLEIIISLGIKLVLVAALGAPAIAVLLFEILLNGTSTFNHANLKIAARTDKFLRLLVVTPNMHRVHHSITPSETNTNFGFSLPWWDHLFGTYRAQPALGHEAMTIGIDQFRSRRDQQLDRMLLQPFIGANENYPMGR